jgi:hypothetical protein
MVVCTYAPCLGKGGIIPEGTLKNHDSPEGVNSEHLKFFGRGFFTPPRPYAR